MENNLNKSGIDAYCDRFCEKLVSQHFDSNDVITGKEILELQEIRQINLFVIKYLLSEWTRETARIRSPYFNYEVPEVKTALKDFMNILSRHIAVEREHFMPLLRQATHDTLLLIFSPYDYYMHLIHNPNKHKISLKELKRMSKYVKINSNLLQGLIDKIEEQGEQKISEEQAGKLLNEVFQNTKESPADVGEYITLFSKIEPLTEAMVYGEPAPAAPENEPEMPWVKKEDALEDDEADLEEEDLEEEDDQEEVQREEASVPATDEALQTLNDKHSGEQKQTLADIHRSRKIESIRKHIGINQRFMFINVLFDGNEDVFNDTIDHLDTCKDRDMAMVFLAGEYPDWDQESEEVLEFFELVEKRF